MAEMKHTKGGLYGPSKVFIATPTYSGKLDASFLHSLLKSLDLFKVAGISYEIFTLSYHCHVDDARNEILTEFLKSKCDQLIFLDADVSWRPEELLKLAEHDESLVAGVYPKRSLHDLEFPVLVEPGVELWANEKGLVEVSGAPTGFMKIKRHVIEELCAVNSHRTFYSKHAKPGDKPHTIIFERTHDGRRRYSGDYSFCKSWRGLGGKVFVDPEMQLSHKGEVEFAGTLGDYWKQKHGVADKELEQKLSQAIARLRQGYCEESDIKDLIQGWGGNPFAAPADLLAAAYWLAKGATGSILEAGSGLSSIVMALANPGVTIHCLEHDILWASKLKYVSQVYGIDNVEVHLAELKVYESGKWYDEATIPNVNYSLALCDGPPRKISNRAIFFEVLKDSIKDAVVLMDDATDEAALMSIMAWANQQNRVVELLGTEPRRFAVAYKEVGWCQLPAI